MIKKMENDNIDELKEFMRDEGFIPIRKFKPDCDLGQKSTTDTFRRIQILDNHFFVV